MFQESPKRIRRMLRVGGQGMDVRRLFRRRDDIDRRNNRIRKLGEPRYKQFAHAAAAAEDGDAFESGSFAHVVFFKQR